MRWTKIYRAARKTLGNWQMLVKKVLHISQDFVATPLTINEIFNIYHEQI